jgi:predicted phage-related endonuclease
MEVAGYEWCAIVALVGGNEQKIVLRNRDRDIGKSIREKSGEFWNRVLQNQAPSADYTRDAEYIIKQLRRDSIEGLVAEADAELEDMIKQFEFVRKEASDLEKIKEQRRAEILDRIGHASKVITRFGSLSTGQVKGRSGTLITPEMVGTVIGATEGYRSFRFYPKKEK